MPELSRQIVNTRQATTAPAAAASVLERASPLVSQGSSLSVSSPGDAAEVEAHSTAARVVRMPAPLRLQRSIGAIQQATVHRSVSTAANGGPPAVSTTAATEIGSGKGGGSPLPDNVRGFMEPRFGADFSTVRVHTDDRAARLSRQLSAQAFTVGSDVFFGRDRFQPGTPEGRELIAHELTHTIQQGAAVQRSADPDVKERSSGSLQRLGLGDALEYIADKANYIPGFRMLTIVLGVNPITMSHVERSAANILRAVVEFMPGGALITQALDAVGVFDRVGGWVEQQLGALGLTGQMFKKAVDTFLDSLSWRDIFSLGSVWTRAKRIVSDPIDRLLGFARGLIVGILGFVRDAVLRPFAKLAEGTPGYDLLRAVLRRDPITGDSVPRTADTLIGGFMKLIGQQEIWENLKKSNAVARAFAWFEGALSGLMAFVAQVPGVFMAALRSLEIVDFVLLPRAFWKVAGAFAGLAGKFFEWAGAQVMGLLEIIFDVLAPAVMPYLRKAAGAFRTIIANPIGFISNLVRAGKQGLQQFASNFLTHLKASIIGWLTGTLAGANIYIPQSFTLREIIKFVLSVLGLTWQNVRAKLVKVIGERPVQVLEAGFDIVVTLVTDGPAAAWQKIQESLTNLREMVMDQVMTFVRDRIVQAAITKLVTSLNPAGAFIQAVIAIYNTVMFFVERMRQIAQVAAAFIDSIAAIAGGAIAAAANRVEQTMGGLLTLVVSFLARLVGLGKVSDAVVDIVNKIRAPIDRALDKVIDWIITMAKKAGKLVVQAGQKLLQWWRTRKTFTANGEEHALFFKGEQGTARLFVASQELAIEEFIKAKGAEAKGDAAKTGAIGRLQTQIAAVLGLIAKVAPDKPDEQLQKDIEKAMNLMAPDLMLLLSSTDWGSQENPAPLDYEKRRAASYPVFYLGEGAASKMTQGQMAANYGAPAFKNSINRYLPTAASQSVPNEQEKLGLASASQVDVGMRFEYADRGVRGSEVKNFKELVIRHGLRPNDYGWDVDHVIELQIGGRDEFRNLWPLPAGENRSSGSIIKHAKTKPPGVQEISVQDALDTKKKDAAAGKKNAKPTLWLVIRTTHQR